MSSYDTWFHRLRSKSSLCQWLLIGAVSTATVVSGIIPSVNLTSTNPSIVFGNAALAQNVTDGELLRYARSVLVIEPMRQQVYSQIQSIMGTNRVPSIACHRPNSLASLPGNIRQIATDYCNRAIQVVESNDISISQFNAITTNIQNDPDLASRIQQILVQLQRGGIDLP
jgi:Domain of unknown function (DUF4168)